MAEIILDVDTGVDDALAILFAVRQPGLRLRAISCVAGNTDVDQVVANTLRVLDAAGASAIPVARGAEGPLLEPRRDARHVHGADGMADLGLPASTRQPAGVHAVELLRKEILAAPEPVTLVTLAPLTNIALLLRTYPEVAGRLGRVMTMGGSASVGNASPVAEFNVWHDPEAAAIVFGAGLPMTMYGLDVFYDVSVPGSVAAELAASDEPGTSLAGRLMLFSAKRNSGDHRVLEAGAAGLGDAGAVCAVADPDGLTTRSLPVTVAVGAGLTRGQTVVDHRTTAGEDTVHGLSTERRPIDVALGVDGPRYRALYLNAVRRRP
ncbi:MAG TPA: nucleoside hydrolase [Pseudonocardiaceae bacterium]|jgi:pyrimidine-specific ribonucleoside hydrolase|nr:nucleoside hydrolase [Pseudonocardiaceae bacterium]